MESIEQVKNRIDSIAGTKQITQSMRLVSTARLQRVRGRMEGNRLFRQETARMVREAAAEHDVRKHRYVRPAPEGAGACVIVVAADRGLCGGYNINVCREAGSLIQETGAAKVIAVGQKAKDYFRRRRGAGGVDKAFVGVSETPFFEDAEEIASCALDWFERGEVGSIYLARTRFVNILTLPPECSLLLPVVATEAAGGGAGGAEGAGGDGPRLRRLARYEPEGGRLLDLAVPFYVASAVFGAMLEASVCEQSARIASMDSAVRNSEDMIETLTLQYNKARQSGITDELADIIGGAAALKKKTARSAEG